MQEVLRLLVVPLIYVQERDEQTFRNPEEGVQSDGESVPVEPFGNEDEVLTDDATDEGDVAEPANPTVSDLNLYSGPRGEKFVRGTDFLASSLIILLDLEQVLVGPPGTLETYDEINTRDDRDLWNQAVQEELFSMKTIDVWKLMACPADMKLHKTKWVF